MYRRLAVVLVGTSMTLGQDRFVWKDAIMNGPYAMSADDGDLSIQLVDGQGQGPPYGDGRPAPYVEILDVTSGDINGDTRPEYLGISMEQIGGSGRFIFLIVYVGSGNQLRRIIHQPLGDRVEVQSLKIRNRVIELDLLRQDNDDGLCCPSLLVRWRFRWKDGKLQPEKERVLQRR